MAAGSVKVALDKIYKDKSWKNCFLAIRPPGHHAAAKNELEPKGFCFINNVVCGARYAQETYGITRIAVFDWDVHHGDSSESLTYDDKEILYISFHRYDDGAFYPGTGHHYRFGEEQGIGYNYNLGWNTKDTKLKDYKKVGNEEHVYAFERLIAPILKEFKPQ